jgi:nitric oxide reductase subunit B
MSASGLKWAAIISFIGSMVIILGGGVRAKSRLSPYPQRVVDSRGRTLFDRNSILAGQAVFQKYGLMDHGSVWGHGTLRGMDFSAATAHKVGEAMREFHARSRFQKPFETLAPEQRRNVQFEVIEEIKQNRYDNATGTLVLTDAQAHALGDVEKFWEREFARGDKTMGFLEGTVPVAKDRSDLARFFFWTAWVATTNRPGQTVSYTNNWPPDPSIGNVPGADVLVWSLGGLMALLLVLGLVIYLVHRYRLFYGAAKGPELAIKLMTMPLTPSQYKAAKFFVVVSLLFIAQTMLGGLLAHYTVSPSSFYVPIVGRMIPYSWAKTWHLQLAILWIATTWVGTAIYLAPVIGQKEPRYQGLLVNILFGALIIVAVGSLLGEAAGIKFNAVLGRAWFWIGHQGWEYLELGRLWQILLFAGLIAWLIIVYRAVAARITLRHDDSYSALITFYVFSAVMIVMFFGFGLFYGPQTHLSLADYWRWFVVHIWVESIFEFFGIGIIALFLVMLGLADSASALRVAYFTAIITFMSGIAGTAHHYFWFGGPAFWLAVGAVFSSLEPIPLILLVVRAWMEYRGIREQGIEFPYRWPLMFLVASSFWNFVGAGVFGFVINLPIINYYEHATYLTINHAHTALFGVYGMLSISLLTFSWRGLIDPRYWSDRLLRFVFWGTNGGLALMALLTLLPVGFLQTSASFSRGIWFARSAEFYGQPVIKFLGNIRVVPDAIIIVLGVVPLAMFLIRTFPHLRREPAQGEGRSPRPG